MSDSPSLLLSAKEVSRLCGISERSWHNLRSQGKTPPEIRLAGSVRWKRSDIEFWIESGTPKRERFIELAQAKKGGQRS